jgi:hypothetical protein
MFEYNLDITAPAADLLALGSRSFDFTGSGLSPDGQVLSSVWYGAGDEAGLYCYVYQLQLDLGAVDYIQEWTLQWGPKPPLWVTLESPPGYSPAAASAYSFRMNNGLPDVLTDTRGYRSSSHLWNRSHVDPDVISFGERKLYDGKDDSVICLFSDKAPITATADFLGPSGEKASATVYAPTAVPDPGGTVLLMGLGLASLALRMVKDRRQ